VAEIKLAAAIVVVQDRVLVVRRSYAEGFLPGRWGVPCGKMDRDEDPRAAVLRELREETGLNGEIIDRVGQAEFPSFWRGRHVYNLQHNFLVTAIIDPAKVDADGMPRVDLPKDDQKAEWVRLGDVGEFGLDLHNLRTIRQGLLAHARRAS